MEAPRLSNGTSSFVEEEAIIWFPAPNYQTQVALFFLAEGSGTVEVRNLNLRPLVLRR